MGIANFGEAQRAGYLKLMALKATYRKTGESPVKCKKKKKKVSLRGHNFENL